ncbi:MAG: ATPase, partial [Deltaproteobacteria bacterium]|nr:ATPase [Deltaproteobacteria bacterium]
DIYIDDSIKDYIVRIVTATRNPDEYGLKGMVEYGASPRGSIYLNKAARGYGFLQGRGYVLPEDIKVMATDVLRHRIILSYEAEAKGMTADEVIGRILEGVPVP